MVIRHLYIERRLIPLDVYLKKVESDPEKQRAAIDEYGRALKELAGANIFAGDLLLKNFGLTRYGRIVFYDYDELCELTDCRFRTMPRPRDDIEEMAASDSGWFNVEKGDVFPEQFPTFLFPPGPQRDIFMELHGDLATAAWWREQQERLHVGIQEDLFAYSEKMRFINRFSESAATQEPGALRSITRPPPAQ